MSNTVTIPNFFKGKNIFITGATGFMGKVLIEKLLRSCPGIENIFILVREKKGKNKYERVESITSLPLFDILKEQDSNAINKIVPILGDVTLLGLGLTDEDRNLLIEHVDIVFHMAASVRFDDSLSDAIIMNTRGTREITKLALQMNKLLVFTHVSTAYTNSEREVVGEELYPFGLDWREAIKLAEELDPHILDVFAEKYMKPLPNTYTFSKRLAEDLVADMCRGKIPLVIVRPSIVVSTATEPFGGWIDNFNGPNAIVIACGKGVLRTMRTNPDTDEDYVSCDFVIKAIIISTWQKCITSQPDQKYEVSVYNACNNGMMTVTQNQMSQWGRHVAWDIPLENVLWYPNVHFTTNWFIYYVRVFFYSLLPAIFLDGLIKLFGHPPLLVKINRKIYRALMMLDYYLNNEWQFKNDKFLELPNKLLLTDVKIFGFSYDYLNYYDMFKTALIGAKTHLLKEKMENTERAKVVYRRMWIAFHVVNSLWYIAAIWLVFFKIDILNVMVQQYHNIVLYFNTP